MKNEGYLTLRVVNSNDISKSAAVITEAFKKYTLGILTVVRAVTGFFDEIEKLASEE